MYHRGGGRGRVVARLRDQSIFDGAGVVVGFGFNLVILFCSVLFCPALLDCIKILHREIHFFSPPPVSI